MIPDRFASRSRTARNTGARVLVAVLGLAALTVSGSASARLPAPSQWDRLPPWFMSAGKLLELCQDSRTRDSALCSAYAQGVIDGIAEGTATAARDVDFCLPEKMTALVALNEALDVAGSQDPGKLDTHDYPAARVMHLYLAVRHPCPATGAGK